MYTGEVPEDGTNPGQALIFVDETTAGREGYQPCRHAARVHAARVGRARNAAKIPKAGTFVASRYNAVSNPVPIRPQRHEDNDGQQGRHKQSESGPEVTPQQTLQKMPARTLSPVYGAMQTNAVKLEESASAAEAAFYCECMMWK
jgi:hypothetical protein